jgi:transposase-like protein
MIEKKNNNNTTKDSVIYLIKNAEVQEVEKDSLTIFIRPYLDKLKEMSSKSLIDHLELPNEEYQIKEEITEECVYYTNLIYSLLPKKKEIIKNIYLFINPDNNNNHLYFIIDIDCNWVDYIMKNIVRVIDKQYSPLYFSTQWVTILQK